MGPSSSKTHILLPYLEFQWEFSLTEGVQASGGGKGKNGLHLLAAWFGTPEASITFMAITFHPIVRKVRLRAIEQLVSYTTG